ncbi:Rxt2p Ecym_3490 [Eremothecium cymbalariae DBVPG|uniref:Transcriptional regulatory protein RXT2 N-terminal domain-containing protein n=1 Tax=Eremothecium cymbalariae (strain CBS 270.75 / DBVPG 7215 / KCTC 17166 / NRRL Y-17582) TaxID=931890 RepID=G8JS53_ERECY|nr:Hypothetical protein Ecym_3490 [Eremothecium cymbalariae DBVPG\
MTDSQSSLLSDEQERKQILNFTNYVLSQKAGNFPALNQLADGTVFPGIRGETTNRGRKLYQNSIGISQKRLKVDTREERVFYSGSEHSLLSRKRMKFSTTPQFNSFEDAQEGYTSGFKSLEDSDDECDDLHRLIDIRKLLSPISNLADVATHPAISRTFRSKVLRDLALDIMLMVEKEQESVISYSGLLEVFLGDYPDALYEDRLALPMYDHKLKLPDDEENLNVTATASSSNKPAKSTTKKGEVPKVEDDDGEKEDPFFALPEFNGNRKLLSIVNGENSQNTEEIETTRQLAQIALQRNQEFIRNLQKIRNCIVKANRIRERILMWAREIAGIPEEDVTIPSALHVVKRGLISATTNHMDEEVEDEEIDED